MEARLHLFTGKGQKSAGGLDTSQLVYCYISQLYPLMYFNLLFSSCMGNSLKKRNVVPYSQR